MIPSEPLATILPTTPTSFASRTCRRLLEGRLSALREGVVEVADGDR